MLQSPLLIPPAADFWSQAALALFSHEPLSAHLRETSDFSALRVLVPSFIHAQHLKSAIARAAARPVVLPRVTTLPAWLAMQMPIQSADGRSQEVSHGERLMSLFAELRRHAWLKKLFSARQNVDLLPLAQTLLTLFDELSMALLPSLRLEPDEFDELYELDERWQAALEQLPPPARTLLSDEAQLVWTLWKSQLGSQDPVARCMTRMMRLAGDADAPLVWVGPDQPDPMLQAFLEEYARHQMVLPVMLDWRADALAPIYAAAWPELVEQEPTHSDGRMTSTPGLSLHAAESLEAEAQHAAQTILCWLRAGKMRTAIIAQDRAVARRVRALLERAEVRVRDETGWKLSTTRSAAALAALLDVVSTRADTLAVLDLLKSPYVCAGMPSKADLVMEIEQALKRRNILGGWEVMSGALRHAPEARALLARIAVQAGTLVGRRPLAEWGTVTDAALRALGMREALEADAAGVQVLRLIDKLIQDCGDLRARFSFAEWRSFLGLQLESAPFVPEEVDRRVVMLQLNGAQLRRFDAVLMLGADADHLPSHPGETLFFANAVRRELGLPTREMRQRSQMRDFCALLSASPEVVLSYQSHRNGEPNPVSPWIARLQLALEGAGQPPVPAHQAEIPSLRIQPQPNAMPAPSAPRLVPGRLSASAYNSLIACPYQFFAEWMLRLDGVDELSDVPEKRDYGEWLHEILFTYHETVRDHKVPVAAREALMRDVAQGVFDRVLRHNPAALSFYARWQKLMPAYLEWANAREENGWHFVFGEREFEKTLHWEGGQVTLHGCIDRVDINERGERAVLDYKTRSMSALRERLKDREDQQLAFYALLSDLPVTAGHYVSLELAGEKIGDIEARNYPDWQGQLESQIVHAVDALSEGAPLPANGTARVCAHCEVRGLCRKGSW